MNIRMIARGMEIYHTTFPHWGMGTVIGFRTEDDLGYPTSRKVLVRWVSKDMDMWMTPSVLRKTPKGTRKGTRL